MYTHTPAVRHLSVNQMCRDTHEKWRTSADRSYSPNNKPWGELDAKQRAAISRDTVNTLLMVNEGGFRVPFIDEYDSPKPGEADFKDPERIPG